MYIQVYVQTDKVQEHYHINVLSFFTVYLSSMQNCNDLSVDLRFYENSDGSVMLESVTSPSCHLFINASNRLSITSVVSVIKF